jgi:hypothetical protein
MSGISPASKPGPITGILKGIEQARHEEVAGVPLTPELALLRAWQVRRLTRTYGDMLDNPRYQPSCAYFINDIYAARDFTQRNHDLQTLYDSLRQFVPETMIRPLSMAIQLNEFTEALDAQLADVLVRQLGMTDKLSVAMYAEGYRRCNNYDERVRQIDLIIEMGIRVEAMVNFPFSSTLIKLGRVPAANAGQSELMETLEVGYRAFKHMRGAKAFLNLIRSREMEILRHIYASDADPFGFGTTRV